ncbi:unnamed protein product [Phaeothamnion confervicola]
MGYAFSGDVCAELRSAVGLGGGLPDALARVGRCCVRIYGGRARARQNWMVSHIHSSSERRCRRDLEPTPKRRRFLEKSFHPCWRWMAQRSAAAESSAIDWLDPLAFCRHRALRPTAAIPAAGAAGGGGTDGILAGRGVAFRSSGLPDFTTVPWPPNEAVDCQGHRFWQARRLRRWLRRRRRRH